MELYAKGQLSYLILTCLQERDFYGLDIITEISNRSNNRINLKKPSVYSNLTRMEKQGYISAYLQSSDFGPNRKYYSLTEKGRSFYKELKTYFDMNNIDVFKDFKDSDDDSVVIEEEYVAQVENKNNEPIENKLEDVKEVENNDFFDFSSLNDSKESYIQDIEPYEEKLDVQEEKQEQKEETITLQEEIVSEMNIEETKIEEPANKDDAVFLNNENVDEYNKRLYDISKDINKIKRKRSFADDQIAMTATDPLYISNEKVKTNIEEFKNSILENREKYQDNKPNSFDYFKLKTALNNKQSPTIEKPEEKKEEIKNDARFITERIDASQVEHAKKIEPPRLKIVTENTKDNRLPAPNRDKTIDPSHREILNKLYSKTKDVNIAQTREDAIYDYNDLKDYYKSQNISFNIYEKNNSKRQHNTNKLYLINSLLSFLICAILSTALYLVLNFVGLTNFNTNFIYIVLPALIVLDIGYNFYNYKNYNGWIPSKIKPQWQIWLAFILCSAVVIGLNFAFGMAVKPFDLFANTLILPLLILFIMLPIRYYLKKFILVKFWR